MENNTKRDLKKLLIRALLKRWNKNTLHDTTLRTQVLFNNYGVLFKSGFQEMRSLLTEKAKGNTPL
jgi:hypothetical protein